MAIRARDIYEGRKKSRGHIGVIITVILVLLTIAVLIFYGLREYAVYDENGNATIVFPWSQKGEAEAPAASSAASPSAAPTGSAEPSQSENSEVSPSAS